MKPDVVRRRLSIVQLTTGMLETVKVEIQKGDIGSSSENGENKLVCFLKMNSATKDFRKTCFHTRTGLDGGG